MTWSVPLTAVANTALTDAQWNASVRDNLLETAPAKATVAGQIFVATGANAIAARLPTVASVAASQTTASNTYVDLATVGPTVTVTTGTNALIVLYAGVDNSGANQSWMGVDISGATTQAATDSLALSTSISQRLSAAFMFPVLAAGSNTFKAKYRTTAGTGTWADRRLAVLPL
jgi:hypothetical protein